MGHVPLDQKQLRSEQSLEHLFYIDELDLLLISMMPSATVTVYSPSDQKRKHELRGHGSADLN